MQLLLAVAAFVITISTADCFLSPYIREPGVELEMMEFDPKLGEKLNAAYWRRRNLETLKKRLGHLKKAGFAPNNKNRRARNVILFVGDGLGVTGVTATRKYSESFNKKPFYENELIWDTFPFAGYSKTYELDNVIADSAGTATAYLAGVKTRQGFIGLDGTGDLLCNSSKGHVDTIASWAKKAGKVAGLVTTTTVTHASPSPLYAQLPAPLRPFEYSGDRFQFSSTHPHCEDIAKQFVKKAQHLKVVFGGGRGYFTPNTEIPRGDAKRGTRNDGRNLINEWMADRSRMSRRNGAVYLTSREELKSLDPKSIDYALGLFHYDHMTFVDDSPPASEPSLAEMTSAAIRILNENKDGYFLFVEGGRIDHGHHGGMARYALREGVEFDRAIRTAVEMTDPSETLIVVTADHSHTLAMGGYLSHNSSILGLSANLGSDKKTYTSLLYANGPGFNLTGEEGPYTGTRRNETMDRVLSRAYRQHAIVPLKMESHGGEDVPVYATGVYSELFTGVFEQSYIPWAMGCASGLWPPGETAKEMSQLCPKAFSSLMGDSSSSASGFNYPTLAGTMLAFIVLAFRRLQS